MVSGAARPDAERGRFISLEGGEGSGKSTQARRLAERLRALGLEVELTREPGGAPLAEAIRSLVLAERPASPEAEFLLFAAARAEHVAHRIRPALARGAWVVCDRFLDSTRVYQGRLNRIPPELIASVEAATVGNALPDLTLILDVDTPTGRQRAEARGDLNRFDAAAGEAHETIRRGFLDVAAAEPERCAVVDASRSPEEVAAGIWAILSARLPVPAAGKGI